MLFVHALRSIALVTATVVALTACSQSPTGRRQLELFAPAQMAAMGDEAYNQIKNETPVTQNAAKRRYVECVTRQLTQVVPKPVDGDSWQVTVFEDDDQVNAFALPGGNIGVYTGLLKAAQNQDQLATVIGHEIAHVQAEHGNARMSTAYATEAGLQLVSILADAKGFESKNAMALLGLGAQVGVLLPFNRAQESEADVLGLRYMAQAGFDPRQSVDLWRNMGKVSGAKPPQFLSTHPSGESRIEKLQDNMGEALRTYEQARQQGKRPDCR